MRSFGWILARGLPPCMVGADGYLEGLGQGSDKIRGAQWTQKLFACLGPLTPS
jgi:hypothetical protein